MDILKSCLIILVSGVLGYIAFRLIALAIFKSWFDVKKSEERRNTHENNKSDRRDVKRSS
jgi:hypothetical protein